jgi:uncharacterized membrane protein YdfJ with MMPL/SSD domain
MHPKKKLAAGVVAAYALLLPLAALLAYKYLGNTNMSFHAPAGTLVRKSEMSAEVHLPTQINTNPVFMLIQQTSGESLVNHSLLQLFTNDLLQASTTGSLNASVLSVQGYFVNNTVLQFRQKLIGGANDDVTFISLAAIDKNTIGSALLPPLKSFNSQWLTSHPDANFTIELTCLDQIGDDLKDGVLGDLAIIDAISMPLAFAALAYCLRSLRLLIMPACTLPSTVLLAFSIMYPVSTMLEVSSFAPEMSAAVMTAISIDYCLFMLSRFSEQVEIHTQGVARKEGLSDELKWRVVRNTAVLTAHNVMISGLTIAVALGGLAFLPVSILSTIGIGLSTGAVSAVFVAMTLMPALLLVFFDFFAVPTTCSLPCSSDPEQGTAGIAGSNFETSTVAASEADLLINGGGSNTSYQAKQFQEQVTSSWFRVGQFAHHHPVVTAAVVALLGVPFFYFSSQLKTDFDMFNQVPRGSVHADTLKKIVDQIGHGSPFYVTFTSSSADNGVWSDKRFFELVNNVTADIVRRTGQPYDRILSPSMLPGPAGLCPDGSCFLTSAESYVLYLVDADYRLLFNQTVSANQQAAVISLFTVFDPFQAEANTYIDHINSAIECYQSNELGIVLGFLGASSDSWAVMHVAIGMFPYQISITFGVIFLFIAAVFRSVFIPFRMILTVGYTIGLSYGLGVIVFQYDWLHTVWHALSNVRSYTWTVPIFSFSLLCALALDYDVFLMTRILEFKTQGYSDEAAISKAVWKTGRIISFAGIIMFIAFGSLTLSNTTMLNEFGLICAFAVLVDTFVIRPLFVPALMSLFPRAAWWPRKFIPDGASERGIADMRGDLSSPLHLTFLQTGRHGGASAKSSELHTQRSSRVSGMLD